MTKIAEDFFNKLDKAKVKIAFGLEAQGHIPFIEKTLKEHGSNDVSWEIIGKEIGWISKYAAYAYINYLMKKEKP